MTYVAAAQVQACQFPEPKLAFRLGLFFTGSGDGSLSIGGYKHGRIRCANSAASVISSLVTESDAMITTMTESNTALSGFQIAW
jgi:hypothetical protein